MLSLIYARSEDYCIGKAGRIPWDLPDEFAHFQRTTRHGAVIMGRRTYEDHETCLPDRLNIVVTTTPGYRAAEGVHIVDSLPAALALARQHCKEVFVVGGARLFAEAFGDAQRVYETVVHTHIEAGDAFVPAFDFSGWQRELLDQHPADARHAFAFTIWCYRRLGS